LCTISLSLSLSLKSRYARWSLGFVDPPLQVSGTGNKCTITALNARGKVLLGPVMDVMNGLLEIGTLSHVSMEDDVIDVRVPPPGEVGSFNEEERSRQVGR
jgi:anthranilate synthase